MVALRIPTTLWFALSGLTAACGGGGGSARTLDCTWASSDDNCWLDLVDQIAACAPPAAETGTFDAERTTCTYAGGWRIEFDAPVPASPEAEHWRFSIYQGDQLCARYEDSATGSGSIDLAVSTAGDEVQAAGALGSGYTLTCPDGTDYVAADPNAVLTCGDPRGYKIPGVLTVRSAPGYAGVAIPLGEEAGGADIEVVLFDCRDP
jgi:hypothetical protein